MGESLNIETGIKGLKIKINKVVTDKRGVLCELSKVESDAFLSKGIKNIYSSMATGKHIPRAGHYHFKNIENFYTLAGTALWFFRDYRKDSSTYKKKFKIILGFDSPNLSGNATSKIPSLTIDGSQMAQVLVPAGVYHIFWPLTEKTVIVLALASELYDKDDYGYLPSEETPDFDSILEGVA